MGDIGLKGETPDSIKSISDNEMFEVSLQPFIQQRNICTTAFVCSLDALKLEKFDKYTSPHGQDRLSNNAKNTCTAIRALLTWCSVAAHLRTPIYT